MTLRLKRSKLRTWLVVALCAGAPSCTPLRRPVPPNELPRRVVLALDGLDYRDVEEARARGQFSEFHPPARLISTFPSISDVAWHAIFGVVPPAGYQRVFYSSRHNNVLGDALSAITPIEYEQRMDYAFDTKFHHLGAYLISWPTARREVDSDVRRILSSRGRETVYLYNVGPDALQHTRGAITQYLDHLDAKLSELQRRYRSRTGRDLEVVLLSDHGHNRGVDAQFVPVVDALSAHGFTVSSTLASPNAVAFSVDGVTTGFGVFCHPDSVARVAGLITATPGVDLVSRQVHDSLIVVQQSRTEAGGISRVAEARVEWRTQDTTTHYRYVPVEGDPLDLHAVVAQMRIDGVIDADGFAAGAMWTRYSAASRYPVAVVRIVHGHIAAARNPAPILVSLDDAYRVGLGMVSVANRMRPLGGTHGALSATNATGVVMSNVVRPHDDLAMTVRAQFGGFHDLREPAVIEPQMSVMEAKTLRDNWLFAREWNGAAGLPDSGAVAVLSLSPRYLQQNGAETRVRVEVRRRDQAPAGGSLHFTATFPLDSLPRSRRGDRWAWPAGAVGLTGMQPGALYAIRVWFERVRRTDTGLVTERAQSVMTALVTAARDGIPWAY